MPSPEKLDKLDCTWVSNVRAYTKNKNGETKVRTFQKYEVPMFWWEPISAWIQDTRCKFIECTLGLKYRRQNEDGSVSGGPMYYLRDGLAKKNMGGLGKV